MTTAITLHAAADVPDASRPPRPVELSFYRDHTLLLLRRYFRLSLQLGRMPSLVGREIFRARVSHYRAHTFEDAVIFVHDVERCLEQLQGFSRRLIALMVFEEYNGEEAARLLHRPVRTIEHDFGLSLEKLTESFLACGILRPMVRPD